MTAGGLLSQIVSAVIDRRYNGLPCAAFPTGGLTKSNCLPDSCHDFIGDGVGALGSFAQHFVNVVGLSQNLFPALAHGREKLPQPDEKLFLELAIAGPTFFEALAHSGGFLRRPD